MVVWGFPQTTAKGGFALFGTPRQEPAKRWLSGGFPQTLAKGALPPSETPVRSPPNDGFLGGVSPRQPPEGALPPSETPVRSPPNDGFLRGSRNSGQVPTRRDFDRLIAGPLESPIRKPILTGETDGHYSQAPMAVQQRIRAPPASEGRRSVGTKPCRGRFYTVGGVVYTGS